MTTAPELRFCPSADLEVRQVGGTVRVAGYASVFGQRSQDLGGFVEEIAPGAFKQYVNSGADILGLYNHDDAYLLGRTASGTLKVAEDKTGLHYEVEINASDPMAAGVAARVARGDVNGSSFSFLVSRDGDEWGTNERDYPLRIVNKVRLVRDVGPVNSPAYEQTDAGLRSALSGLAERRSLDLATLVAAAHEKRLSDALTGSWEPPAPEQPTEPLSVADIVAQRRRLYSL